MPISVSEVLTYPPDAVLVIAGIPGAGKSTLIRRLFGPGTGVRVLDPERVRDRWRALLGGTRRGYGLYRPLVHLEHYGTIAAALAEPGPLVVHECGTRPWLRRALARAAGRQGRPVHLLFLDVDRPTAEAGQVARGRRVRAASMDRHAHAWGQLRRRLAEGWSPLGEGYASVRVLDRAEARELDAVCFSTGQVSAPVPAIAS